MRFRRRVVLPVLAAVLAVALLLVWRARTPSGDAGAIVGRARGAGAESSAPRLEGVPPPAARGMASREAASDSPLEDSVEELEDTRMVEGLVLDVASGRAVAFLPLRLRIRGLYGEHFHGGFYEARARTDRDGRFSLPTAGCIRRVRSEDPSWHCCRWTYEGEDDGSSTRFDRSLPIRPVVHVQRSFGLKGRVRDGRGEPLAGVVLRTYELAYNPDDKLRPRVLEVKSDAEGRFEIAPIPERPDQVFTDLDPEELARWGALTLEREGYVPLRVDPRKVPFHEREDWEVTLEDGYTLAGVLLDEDHQPLAGVLVAAEYGEDGKLRRGARTDGQGRWSLDALSPESMLLRAYAFEHEARAERAFRLRADDLDVRLVAERIRLQEPPVIVRVLGVGLADVTEEMRRAYFVPDRVGVLILEVDGDPRALGIGRLEPGYGLVTVNRRPVTSVEQALELLLQPELLRRPGRKPRCEVVYTLASEKRAGETVRLLDLTPDRRRAIERVLAELRR